MYDWRGATREADLAMGHNAIGSHPSEHDMTDPLADTWQTRQTRADKSRVLERCKIRHESPPPPAPRNCDQLVALFQLTRCCGTLTLNIERT